MAAILCAILDASGRDQRDQDGTAVAITQSGRDEGLTNTRRIVMINLILILIVGGLIGWIASIVMRTNAQQGVLLNVVVGIVGALLAGFLLAPLFGTGNITSGDFSLPALLVSLLGSVILLAIVNLFRRGAVR
jgi:uncharacterized membrane protein YeaQ/YmgE (transglycosylase-associated protein family)